MKKTIVLILSMIMILGCGITVISQDGIYAQKVDFSIYLNHIKTAFRDPVYLLNDRTYVPLRELSEKQDFEVVWDGEQSSIDLIKEEKEETYPEVREQMKEILSKLDADCLKTVQQLMELESGDSIEKVFEVMGGPGEEAGYGFIIYKYKLNSEISAEVFAYLENNKETLYGIQIILDKDSILKIV